MDPEGSLPHSQQPATSPYSEPDRSSPCPQSHFCKIHFNIIPHLRLGLPSNLFPSSFPTKTLYASRLSPIRATCSAHFILRDLIAPMNISVYTMGKFKNIHDFKCHSPSSEPYRIAPQMYRLLFRTASTCTQLLTQILHCLFPARLKLHLRAGMT